MTITCIVNPATPRIVKIVAMPLANCLLDSATHAALGRVDAWAVRQSTTATLAWTYPPATPAKMNTWLYAISAVTSSASTALSSIMVQFAKSAALKLAGTLAAMVMFCLQGIEVCRAQKMAGGPAKNFHIKIEPI